MKKLVYISFVAVVWCLIFVSFSNAQQTKKKAGARSANGKTKTRIAAKSPTSKNAGQSLNGEPSEEEMRQAIIRTMQMLGAQKRQDGSVGVDNPLNGMSVKIVEFEKIGCQRANYGAGYFCTYNITNSLAAHSNEGTADGDRHTQGVNLLIQMLNGGRNTVNETFTARFFKSKAGWITSKD